MSSCRHRTVVVLLLLTLACPLAHAADTSLEPLFEQLDEAIAHWPEYVAAHERSIAQTKTALRKASTPAARYKLCRKLFELYRSYCNDSAIVYINQAVDIAHQAKRKDWEDDSQLHLAYQCCETGLFTEAWQALTMVDKASLTPRLLTLYYINFYHYYSMLAYYTKNPRLRDDYYREMGRYESLVVQTAAPDDDYRLQIEETQCADRHDGRGALRINDRRLAKAKVGSHQYAIVAFYRYVAYGALGNDHERIVWLTRSAITDVKNAVMDQGAMWEIANIMKYLGQPERSYNYIRFASDCASRFGSRVREGQVAKVVSIIGENYQSLKERKEQQLKAFLIVLLVAVVVLVALLYVVVVQRRRLALSRQQLKESNTKLAESNQKLEEGNDKLREVNTELQEANTVKIVSLGLFISLCSHFIDDMTSLRKTVNKMVRGRSYADLYEMTKNTDVEDKEYAVLYDHFDKAFTKLFPNFIDSCNALLRPEERMQLKKDEILNTNFRILALIRLGIDDSSQIARFLNLSANTIYNYRAAIKKRALDRDHFEERVKEIGM